MALASLSFVGAPGGVVDLRQHAVRTQRLHECLANPPGQELAEVERLGSGAANPAPTAGHEGGLAAEKSRLGTHGGGLSGRQALIEAASEDGGRDGEALDLEGAPGNRPAAAVA